MASAANGAKPISNTVASSPMAMNFIVVFPSLLPAPVIEISRFIFNFRLHYGFPLGAVFVRKSDFRRPRTMIRDI